MANIFLRVDNKMTGLRLPLGPAFLPGFWSGINMPSFISVGYTPDSDMRLNISAIYTNMISGPYFSISPYT